MTDPTFEPGACVVATDVTEKYKRRPGYAERASGTVERVHGAYRPPAGGGREVLYAVRFDPGELWTDPEPNGAVYVDLWESALAPAPERTAPDPE